MDSNHNILTRSRGKKVYMIDSAGKVYFINQDQILKNGPLYKDQIRTNDPLYTLVE